MEIPCFILAGGKGTRLRPATYKTPKPLLKVGNKPMINHTMKFLKNNGVTDIIISTGYMKELIKAHIGDVFRRAQVNKASRIYEHGISMEKTAKILGITVWELAEYAGRTRIGDVNLSVTMPIKQRIKIAEEIFS